MESDWPRSRMGKAILRILRLRDEATKCLVEFGDIRQRGYRDMRKRN